MKRSEMSLEETSHLTVIARPAGHVLLRLDVVYGAEGLDSGLRHDGAHDFTFHRHEGVPVAGDLLIRSQLQFAGKRMGVVHGCREEKGFFMVCIFCFRLQIFEMCF